MSNLFKPFVIVLVVFMCCTATFLCSKTCATEINISEKNKSDYHYSVQNKVKKIQIIENGKSSIIENNNDELLEIGIDKNKIKNTIIKVQYEITVKNIGKDDLIVSEIQDYIPSGFSFYEEDNIDWVKNETVLKYNGISNTIITPGKSEKIYIILRWKNQYCNLGIKTNYVEATKVINTLQERITKSYSYMTEANYNPIVITGANKTRNNAVVLICIFFFIVILGIYVINKEFSIMKIFRTKVIMKSLRIR